MTAEMEGLRLGREIEVAVSLALEAGEVIGRHRRRGVERMQKESGELVTAADIACDALIRSGLAAAFPEDAIVSEENAPAPSAEGPGRTWVVDPIDGTSDFASGGDEHAVSIGLVAGGRPVLGVVYNPARSELFTGAADAGVHLNGRRAAASVAVDLASARISVSRKEWRRGLDRLARALPLRTVASVAYKLARVAAGVDDATFYVKPRRAWDICAGVALVLAGGGVAELIAGGEIPFDALDAKLPGGILACGRLLRGPLVDALQRLLAA